VFKFRDRQQKAADFKPVAAVVRRLPRKFDVKYWIGITLAVIAILQAQTSDRKLDTIESQVQQIYSQVMSNAARSTPLPLPSAAALPTSNPYPKAGRNQPCPCGSGKKYKRCHGA